MGINRGTPKAEAVAMPPPVYPAEAVAMPETSVETQPLPYQVP